MHVMFIHPNFPAQFGHVADEFARTRGWNCTFVTSIDTSHYQLPFVHINYRLAPGPQPKTFYNTNSLQVLFDHLGAVYRCLRSLPQIKPDLVVGHVSYGTMLYLKNLYPSVPFVGYFELLPPPFWSPALALRPDFPPPEEVRLFNATYHTLTYLHLHAMDAGYTPTAFQLGLAPAELAHKLRVIFDGVNVEFFRRRPLARPLSFRGAAISPQTRVVTYVSRGLEAIRGFDIFMRLAKRIYQAHPDVLFLVAGEERTNYGHEGHHIGAQSFKQYVLSQDHYDLGKFHFLGRIPPDDLVTLYSLSDLHVYLTVPYVLSWSLVQAMAAECTIVGSATAPVTEVIEHGVHGLLSDFYDVDALAAQALDVLRDPAAFRPLGANARARVVECYESRLCTDQLAAYFESLVR